MFFEENPFRIDELRFGDETYQNSCKKFLIANKLYELTTNKRKVEPNFLQSVKNYCASMLLDNIINWRTPLHSLQVNPFLSLGTRSSIICFC